MISDYLCFCGTQYGGFDCSIDLTIPPILYEIIDGNLCDVRTDPAGCKQITVSGSKFAPSLSINKLRCHLRPLSVSDMKQSSYENYIFALCTDVSSRIYL